MKQLSIWIPFFLEANESAMGAIANTVSAAGEQINQATNCTRTVFMKEVDVTSDSTTTVEDNTIITINKKKGAFGGLFGGNRSSASTQNIVTRTDHNTENYKMRFIPHCVQWQVDPERVIAILKSQQLGIAAIVGTLQVIFNSAPVAEEMFAFLFEENTQNDARLKTLASRVAPKKSNNAE